MNGKVKIDAAPRAFNDFTKNNGTSSYEHDVFTEGPSLTRQEFADECDINNIMQRYDAYLSDPMKSVREPIYYDFTKMPDTLMGAMDVILQAQDAFMSMPAKVRKEFDNDPAAFADFASDPANLEQMREWGLAAPEKPAEKPMRVEVVSPAPPPADAQVPPKPASEPAK